MRIVIDLQGAQSGSRFRGIGRYSLALALAMARNAVGHELHVVLNGRFGESIEPIIRSFDGKIPRGRFHVWLPYKSGGVIDNDVTDEIMREAFIARLKPDIVHISSLFEGLGEAAITSIGMYRIDVLTAVTLFDLIPLIYRKPYLENPVMARWYFSKLAHMRRADLLLGISSSATQEGVDYLGFNKNRAVNISSAIDDIFRKLDHGALDEAAIRARYGLDRKFVMYTGGIDHRKNIEGLIRAFAMLPVAVRREHQLAIVCSVHDEPRTLLLSLAREHGLRGSDIVLTGYVPEDDLVALYNLCKLFVFPSWHEGFGLPALEAMQCGAPVIGANTSSLPEVIGLNEALFDPYSDSDIANHILRGLTDTAFRERLIAHAAMQTPRFSWDESARKALAAMAELVADRASTAVAQDVAIRSRPRLAYVSPMPPERSGIADYSAELLPELTRFYEVDLILHQSQLSDLQVAGVASVRDLAWFAQHGAAYDRVLYHFGNSMYHGHMVDLLERVPGVVVLHDFYLSGMYAYREIIEGFEGIWTRALYATHGYAPLPRKVRRDHDGLMRDYPCNFEVLNNALGVVVHSSYSKVLAADWFGAEVTQGWQQIPLLRVAAVLEKNHKSSARLEMDLPEDGFVVCSFGFMAPSKQNILLLRAWLSSSISREPNAYLVFVGQADGDVYGTEISSLIAGHDAGERVRITGYADLVTYRNYLEACDLAVQLRTHSRGETSGAVLDAMNYGVATVINSNGSLADLPGNVVCKLRDAFAEQDLVDAIERLRNNDVERGKLGAAGREWIVTQHAPRRCAELYRDTIEGVYRGERAQMLPKLADHLAWGAGELDEAQLAKSLGWSFPRPSSQKQILIDIGDGFLSDGDRQQLRELLLSPPSRMRIEPIRWSGECYLYARAFALELIDCSSELLKDESIDVWPGDIVLATQGGPEKIRDPSLAWRGASLLSLADWLATLSNVSTATPITLERNLT